MEILKTFFFSFQKERFAPSIQHFETVVKNTERIVKAAKILKMKCILTEQYPKVILSLKKSLTFIVVNICWQISWNWNNAQKSLYFMNKFNFHNYNEFAQFIGNGIIYKN